MRRPSQSMSKTHRLGQHLLDDEGVLDRMVASAEISETDVVYEIGSGDGRLTRRLCREARHVISKEIDPDLYLEARSRLSGIDNLTLENGDGLEGDEMFDVLVSDLPYSESGRFIEWLVFRDFRRAVVMLQQDFVAKLLAPAGSPNYRAISSIARSCLSLRELEKVSAASFIPHPRVPSTLIAIEQRRRPQIEDVRLMKMLFSFKGRKVSAALKIISKKRKIKFQNLALLVGERMLDSRISHLDPDEAFNLASRMTPREVIPS